MDLGAYMRVLSRFKVLIILGFLLAAALAFLATAKVSFRAGKPHVTYRQSQLYQADTILLVTQQGFPWGRTVLPASTDGLPTGTQSTSPQYADPNRLAGLAVFYAELANGDAVQAAIKRDKSLHGLMNASATLPNPSQYNSVLPFVDIQGFATTPHQAVLISSKGTAALQRYIEQQQSAAGIAQTQRVLLDIVKKPDKVTVAVRRKKTLPIMVFLIVFTAALGSAFILENLRPRVRRGEPDLAEVSEAPGATASARQIA